MFRDPEKGKAEWKDILPHTDAQILFNALGQSGPTSAAGYEQMTDRLRQLQPYGQTPLYYSIQFAAEQFPKSNQAGIPRQIIVLTDGLNDTYHFDNQGLLRPRSIEGGRDSDFAYYNELVRNDSPTELLRGIQVQIVAVDVVNTDPKAEALFAKKKLQLEKIAQATGGKTLYPRSIDELKQHLDRIVNDEVWTVRADRVD